MEEPLAVTKAFFESQKVQLENLRLQQEQIQNDLSTLLKAVAQKRLNEEGNLSFSPKR